VELAVVLSSMQMRRKKKASSPRSGILGRPGVGCGSGLWSTDRPSPLFLFLVSCFLFLFSFLVFCFLFSVFYFPNWIQICFVGFELRVLLKMQLFFAKPSKNVTIIFLIQYTELEKFCMCTCT
jgi:hypothetical protein